MILESILLIVSGLFLINFSGSITKRIIRENNPAAYNYTAIEMKREWQAVAGTGLVPSWVSLISIGGWLILAFGAVKILAVSF